MAHAMMTLSTYEQVAALEKRKRSLEWAYTLHVHYIVNNDYQKLYDLDKFIKDEDEAIKGIDPDYLGIPHLRISEMYFFNRTEINDKIAKFLANEN